LGDLYITSPEALVHDDLQEAFGKVSVIRGDLIVAQNLDLTDLRFFQQLREVGEVKILYNPHLVDARLPSGPIFSSVKVTGNPRLCAGRYPNAAVNASQSECVLLEMYQYIEFETEGLSNNSLKIEMFLQAATALSEFAGQTVC
jgi:hypothetical protein